MQIKSKQIIRRVAIFAGCAVIFFAVANFQYLLAQIRWLTDKPQVQIEQVLREDEVYTPNLLVIPSIGLQAPLLYAQENSEKHFQELLKDGVVHYSGTALPGEYGNVYIFGHSSDFAWTKGDYKTVFAHLPKLSEGYEIYLTDSFGKRTKYVVRKTLVVGPDAVEYLSQYEKKERLLTLQTSYPVGTALRRFLVIASAE